MLETLGKKDFRSLSFAALASKTFEAINATDDNGPSTLKSPLICSDISDPQALLRESDQSYIHSHLLPASTASSKLEHVITSLLIPPILHEQSYCIGKTIYTIRKPDRHLPTNLIDRRSFDPRQWSPHSQ